MANALAVAHAANVVAVTVVIVNAKAVKKAAKQARTTAT